jgi:hypothetical protein
MAKNDNLTDLLTDIADAIRAKKGTTNKINPQNFSSEIASISTSGVDKPEISPNELTFYDYDGTILHSYTYDEFLGYGLSYSPSLPTSKGLICQQWNNSGLALTNNIKYGHKESGAIYITDDGKTRLYIRLLGELRTSVPLYFTQTVANGVTIDWGDGSATQTVSGTGNVNTSHTYADVGDYVITLDVADGCTMSLGRNSSYFVFGQVSSKRFRDILRKVEIGKNVTQILAYAFYYCHELEYITIPTNVTSIGSSAFRYCYSLRHINLPPRMSSIGTYAFSECYSLRTAVVNMNLDELSSYAFYYCYSLSSISLPYITSLPTSVFQECYSLARASFGPYLNSVSSYAFRNCYSLTKAYLKCSSINTNAYNGCVGMALFDFSACAAVPSLANTNAFTSVPSDCKIIVPDDLYDTWKAATNWSTYASRIVKASEFNG